MQVGLDYALRGPQRLAVMIDSTGSAVMVKLTSIKSLNLKAANAQVTVTGAVNGGDHSIEVVNRKAVFNLDSVTDGQFKVNATNAEVVMTLPKSSNAQVKAKAVPGTIAVNQAGQPTITDNPYKQSFGSGAAQIVIESVSGKITITFK